MIPVSQSLINNLALNDRSVELRAEDPEPNKKEEAVSSPHKRISERAECYPRVIARLNDRWRVIVCKQGIQWILQKAKTEGGHGLAWRAVGYFLTRKALIGACARIDRAVDPAELNVLHQLPIALGRSP